MFLTIFRALYLGDGIFGFFTGYGYLDMDIFTNGWAGLSSMLVRVLAILHHIALGTFAMLAGLKIDRA